MTAFKSSISINAPKDKVWEVLADLGGIQRYNAAVKKSYYHTPKTEGIGAGRVCELLPFGRVEETVSQWSDGRSYTLDVTPVKGMPPLKNVQATLSAREEAQRTVVEMNMSYQMKFGPIGKAMDAIMVRPQFAQVVPNILMGLKHFVETGEEVTPQVIKRIRASGEGAASPSYAS